MRYNEILSEVHWTDLYPESFQEFMNKYKRVKGGKDNLYIQFTNFNIGTSKKAYSKPDHNDPVGVYGYPLAYVVSHPADIWYGMKAKYLRVLKLKSDKVLHLQNIDKNNALNILYNMGIPNYRDIYDNQLKYLKKSKHKKKEGRAFMNVVQFIFDDPDYNSENAKQRSGIEQTRLFKKAGYDAVLDNGRNEANAIINDREPEQIIFLAASAFDVIDVINLREDDGDNTRVGLTSQNVNSEEYKLKLIDIIAKYFETTSIERIEQSNVSFFDNGFACYVSFERPNGYYDDRRIGSKKHKEHKEDSGYNISVQLLTDYGRIEKVFTSGYTFKDIGSYLNSSYNNLKKSSNRIDNWTPYTKEAFIKKEEESKKEYYRKQREEKNKKRNEQFGVAEENLVRLAKQYSIPFDPTSIPDDKKANIIMMLEEIFNKCRDLSYTTKVDDVKKECKKVLNDWAGRLTPSKFFIVNNDKDKASSLSNMPDYVKTIFNIIDTSIQNSSSNEFNQFGFPHNLMYL